MKKFITDISVSTKITTREHQTAVKLVIQKTERNIQLRCREPAVSRQTCRHGGDDVMKFKARIRKKTISVTFKLLVSD